MMPADSMTSSFWKLVALAISATACGFLFFRMQHILEVTHHTVSLHDLTFREHLCSFSKCHLLSRKASSSPLLLPAAPDAPPSLADYGLTEDDVKALSARVCGSPAVDGYAHVVPKCLEESPTALWWKKYYEGGGRQEDLVAHIEASADYDGLAVGWGIGNKKATVEECAQACLDHKVGSIGGPFANLPCNAFTWCPDEICFEPDAHTHTKHDCWLKFTEGPASPEINFRGKLPPEYRQRHPTSPDAVQWWGGVVLPAGVKPTNGTYGPRWMW